MSARQLSLTESPRPRRTTDTYRMVRVLKENERNPARRGHVALDAYTGRPKPPRWMICHPEDAAAIGAEVEGVMVIATGTARNVYLLGPLEI